MTGDFRSKNYAASQRKLKQLLNSMILIIDAHHNLLIYVVLISHSSLHFDCKKQTSRLIFPLRVMFLELIL